MARAPPSREDQDWGAPARWGRGGSSQGTGRLPALWALLAAAGGGLSAEFPLPIRQATASEPAGPRGGSHRDEPGSAGLARFDGRRVEGRNRFGPIRDTAAAGSRSW